MFFFFFLLELFPKFEEVNIKCLVWWLKDLLGKEAELGFNTTSVTYRQGILSNLLTHIISPLTKI